MAFRAKAFVASTRKNTDGEGNVHSVSVDFYGVYTTKEGIEGNATEENRSFGQWTPSFTVSMTVTNPAVFKQLEQGKEFYVDFTPAE